MSAVREMLSDHVKLQTAAHVDLLKIQTAACVDFHWSMGEQVTCPLPCLPVLLACDACAEPCAVRAVQWDATWQGVERPSEAEIEGRA